MVLEKLLVKDCLWNQELPPSFESLVYSHQEGEQSSGHELVRVTYIYRLKNDADNMRRSFLEEQAEEPQYEAYIKMNRLCITLNQRTWLALNRYMNSYEPSSEVLLYRVDNSAKPKTEVVVPRTR